MKFKNLVVVFISIPILAAGIFLVSGCGKGSGGNSEFDNADIVRGGQLYDKWWSVSGVLDPNKPTSDNPDYALTQGTKTGADTWRCKECHGWDYQGREGAYKQGSSHFTGVIGLMHASEQDEADELFGTIKDGLQGTGMSSFSSHLADTDIWDVVKFIKEGIIDDSQYIDYQTKKPLSADAIHGASLFNSVCASCHGSDGKQINFGDQAEPEYVGTVASDNPWEALHKIRFGQPGTAMPSGIKNNWSIQDCLDVLGHAQTLPAN